ncbi:MAG: CmpA/NrtA family ABC transporter substrate-binding protein [Chthoniobacteraceae bacterium]
MAVSPGWQESRAEGPEVSQINLAVLPLTDCASIVAAHEKGFFETHGIDSSVVKFTSWTGLRDAVVQGAVHGAQMLFGMPIAAACGRLGSKPTPLVVPLILSRNGQAISLISKYKGLVGSDPSPLRPIAQKGRDAGRPLVFAHTLPVGTHSYWLRYWLAAGFIHPDNDVALITCPPPMMVRNVRQATMDGFCAGEPWNAHALDAGLGYTAITSREIWQDHPEKVLAFTEDFAEKNPRTVKAVLKALRQAGEWCDAPDHREELAGILSRPEYVNVPADLILDRLNDGFACGDGREHSGSHQLTFSERNCNYPQYKHAIWFLTQMYRWGIAVDAPDYGAAARRMMRPELFEEAMAELGVEAGSSNLDAETLFDGHVFDPTKPDEYAHSFNMHNLRH